MARRGTTYRLKGRATFESESALREAFDALDAESNAVGQPTLGAALRRWMHTSETTVELDMELEIPPPVAALIGNLLQALSHPAESSDLDIAPV